MLLSFFLLGSAQIFSQVNVTIKVDMSSATVSADGVHIAGSLNAWDTSSTQLTQVENSSIYEVTLQLNEGWYEYKFLNGNAWGTEEQAGYPCAPSNGNRFLYVNNSGTDVSLVAVPFNGCNAENTSLEVTLNVDMSSETVSENGVKIAGWLNGWNGDNLVMPVVDGTTYSATLRLPTPADYPITLEYKFVNGSDWETPSAECATVVNSNRVETITTSGQQIFNVFNGCNAILNTERFITGADVTYTKSEGLVLNGFENQSKLNVQVFNLLGQNVFSTSLITNNNKKAIQLNSIETGVFIVKITDASQRYLTKKIINF